MTIRGTTKRQDSSWAEPNLFGSDQPDLFGNALAPKPFEPDPKHVRNSLKSLLSRMQAAQTWPWSDAMVRLHREQTFDYLCGLICDPAEREDWEMRIAAQITRLDAATAISSNAAASSPRTRTTPISS
ncbi:MAG: hypothetical protein ACTSUY_00910 [Alphaproteobacteria bacterium]